MAQKLLEEFCFSYRKFNKVMVSMSLFVWGLVGWNGCATSRWQTLRSRYRCLLEINL